MKHVNARSPLKGISLMKYDTSRITRGTVEINYTNCTLMHYTIVYLKCPMVVDYQVWGTYIFLQPVGKRHPHLFIEISHHQQINTIVCADNHGSQRMKPESFGDPLMFPGAPSWVLLKYSVLTPM